MARRAVRANPRDVAYFPVPHNASYKDGRRGHDDALEHYYATARDAITQARTIVLRAQREGLGGGTTYDPREIRAAGVLLRDTIRHVMAAEFAVSSLDRETYMMPPAAFERERDFWESEADVLQRWIVTNTKLLLRHDVVDWNIVSARQTVVRGGDVKHVLASLDAVIARIDQKLPPVRAEAAIRLVRRALSRIARSLGYQQPLLAAISGDSSRSEMKLGAAQAVAELRAAPRQNPHGSPTRRPRPATAATTGPAGALLLATIVLAGGWFLLSARHAFTLPPGQPAP